MSITALFSRSSFTTLGAQPSAASLTPTSLQDNRAFPKPTVIAPAAQIESATSLPSVEGVLSDEKALVICDSKIFKSPVNLLVGCLLVYRIWHLASEVDAKTRKVLAEVRIQKVDSPAWVSWKIDVSSKNLKKLFESTLWFGIGIADLCLWAAKKKILLLGRALPYFEFAHSATTFLESILSGERYAKKWMKATRLIDQPATDSVDWFKRELKVERIGHACLVASCGFDLIAEAGRMRTLMKTGKRSFTVISLTSKALAFACVAVSGAVLFKELAMKIIAICLASIPAFAPTGRETLARRFEGVKN